MDSDAMELELRTGLRILAAVALAAAMACGLSKRGRLAGLRALGRVQNLAETRFREGLTLLLGFYFVAAWTAKLSQLHALELHGQDFWLFEDMLAQMMRGGFFLTRYAPQAVGWVQHGAVHPMLSWALVLPLSWLTGPTHAALLFGPLVLTAAGGILAALARPRFGSLGAWAATAAFLASSQVARLLMYEVHPEAAYPLAVFAWAWAAGWGEGKLRPKTLLLATALLMAIKEDSFTVLPPLILATALFRHDLSRRWLALSALLATGVCAFQFHAVHQWSSGAWGPQQWLGSEVVHPLGAAPMRHHHWDGPSSAWTILEETIGTRGGLSAVLGSWLQFLVSRPWLGLLALAPWVVLSPLFWMAVLPLTAVYSLLDDPSKLINYYSAPLLGSFWLATVSRRSSSPRFWAWLLVSSLLLGGSGIRWYLEDPLRAQASLEVRQLVPCLPESGSGVVGSRFIGLVPHEKILSDRVPQSGEVRFYFLSRQLPSYEIPPEITESLIQRLKKDPQWVQLGKNCQPLRPGDSNFVVQLFVRR
jgi:hypothetical protein